jgi:hypothetical protein
MRMASEYRKARRGECLILFHKPGFGLDEAFRVLSAQGDLSVTRKDDALGVQRFGGPALTVRFAGGPTVQRVAVELGEDTRHAEGLGRCDAWFQIVVDDLDAALNDSNGLIVVQGTLLEATQGFQFTEWNGNLFSAAELAGP